MASGFTVATTFKARGNLGNELKRVEKGFGSVGRAAQFAKRAVMGVTAGVLITGTAALALGVRELKTEYIDLDHAVTSAAAKWGDEFDRGTQGFNQLLEAAKAVGLTTEHSGGQAANGLNYLAMAGFSAAEAIELLPGVANLATAANLDFATSTDIASDSLGAFGLAQGTAQQKADAFKMIMEQVASTTNKTNTDITQWFEAVTDGAPTFTTAGQSVESFNTAVGLLANNGIKGSKAGIALRGVMSTLSKTSGRSAVTLRKLGVTVRDGEGNFRDFADIIEDLDKALEGKGTADRTGYLEKIFGKRQMSQMSILLKEGADRFRSLRAEIEDSADADVDLASKMRMSVQNSLKLVESALLGKGIDIIQTLFGGEDPGEALTNLATAIQDFDTSGIVKMIQDVISVIKESAEWIYENRTLLIGLGKAFLAFKIGSFVADLSLVGAGLLNVAVGFENVTGNTNTAATAARNAQGVYGGLASKLRSVNALMLAFAGGYAAGEAFWAAVENQQRKAVEKENSAVRDTVGTSNLSYKEAKSKLDKRLRDWEKGGYNRQMTGTGDVEAFGELSQVRNVRIQQEAIQALQRRMDNIRRGEQNRAAAFARGGRGNWQESEDWQQWTGWRHKQTENSLGFSAAADSLPWDRGTQRTESTQRTENVERFEVDWGTPPEGVTIKNEPSLMP